ncbi:MAG: sulfatase-like hydrolase/transferase [Planctomycetales bacterium]|nr:sulfatase-like hydrolase/transferase [Planctomycetales bacterium]
MNTLVITIEGLATGLIGAYGASQATTPTIDRIAAYGIVLDQCFVDSQEPMRQLESLWTGRHALQQRSAWSLWRFLKNQPASGQATLITDCPDVALLAEQLGCSNVTLVPVLINSAACGEPDECAVLGLFAAAADLMSQQLTGLVWVHSRGLRWPWDAPIEMRLRCIDPDDPEPPSSAELPAIKVDQDTDPDLIVGWGQVATAQAAVVDHALELLLAARSSSAEPEPWSTVLIGLGGVPLGEHGHVGWQEPQLYGEELACVAIVQPGYGLPVGYRLSELCQLPDLTPSILDCMLGAGWQAQKATADESMWGRSILQLQTTLQATIPNHHRLAVVKPPATQGMQRWVRSPAWSILSDDRRSQTRLFVKPDDRWEVSDVASRRHDIVQLLEQVADGFECAIAANSRESIPPIDDELWQLIR